MLLFDAESFVLHFAVQKYQVKICRTIILPLVLYGCEMWSPTVSKEHWLRVFRSRVLMKIFGPTRSKAMGEWGRRHNETLYDP